MPRPCLFSYNMFVFLSMIVSSISAPSPSDDATTLLRFKESLKDDSNALASWNPATTPCFAKKNNWVGLVCSRDGSVWGIKLENTGLSGKINVDALAGLERLRSISFMNNKFKGPMPDFRRVKTLKWIFLSNNGFEGPIDPKAFEGLGHLRQVDLANNKFRGGIPTSLVELKKLVELRLEGNQFEGKIPDLASTMIQSFNVSNNQLEGPIPKSVAKFDPTAFAGREDFEVHMRRLGRLSHSNLLPFVAYYYRKEEKLMITDAVQKGSLALLLHGQKGKTKLDWPTRLKVLKGIAKGLEYLYDELPSLAASHGHLKSSNVLLTSSFEPLLGDYGLIPLINQKSAQKLMVACKSPEYLNNGRITKKTDVWALGILIIEILTGELPAPYLQQGSEADMGSWVESVVAVGFDKNMEQHTNSDGEMQKLLNIGLACCVVDVEKRLDIKEACEKIQEVREESLNDFTVIIE